MPRVLSENRSNPNSKASDVEKVPPGTVQLPDGPAAFVDEVHLKADFIELAKALLNAKDDKIRQRALERLLDMKYKSGAPAEETQEILFDLPRPLRD